MALKRNTMGTISTELAKQHEEAKNEAKCAKSQEGDGKNDLFHRRTIMNNESPFKVFVGDGE